MVDTIRELTRQLKLKQNIIECFIPYDEAQNTGTKICYILYGEVVLFIGIVYVSNAILFVLHMGRG